ncbi:MAG: GxxExxY protein [Gammaproteobacteria bacterium]|nr:GxxExxY protein [Gammaproteobacteria bacterium]
MDATLNALSGEVIGAAIEVHRHLGPGLLESVYRRCLLRELELRGLRATEEAPVRAVYKGLSFDAAYRMDILVEDKLAVELKVVERLAPVHEAQLLSYLRLAELPLGLLINFHVRQLSAGVKRVINTC